MHLANFRFSLTVDLLFSNLVRPAPEADTIISFDKLTKSQKITIWILHEKLSLAGRAFSDTVMALVEITIKRYAMRMYPGENLFDVINFYLKIYATSELSPTVQN